ncbi:Retrotransposon-derived PEG10 [Pelobates cultripes]|uniref:Retrotransposon-derived PEG10 n=1 Tax=Pelobates cultripes TaxID=61616 RepID=A0AAD1WGA7_PELCU|nr:Retrotransposon-derived PEG10 [Pelobates cultripes]
MDIEEPMQIGALNTMLTVTEKARRKAKGLCFYCGKGGHYISYCPIRSHHPKQSHVGALYHHPASPPWPLFCSTLHATGPKRPPNQTNGTITALAKPAPVPEPQKEAAVATFQSPASFSPNVSCFNRNYPYVAAHILITPIDIKLDLRMEGKQLCMLTGRKMKKWKREFYNVVTDVTLLRIRHAGNEVYGLASWRRTCPQAESIHSQRGQDGAARRGYYSNITFTELQKWPNDKEN